MIQMKIIDRILTAEEKAEVQEYIENELEYKK
jgi:hypothetical protein